MATLRIEQSDLARDLHAILAKVQKQGLEILVEKDHAAVAVIGPAVSGGRLIEDILRDMRANPSTATLDDGFSRDLEEIIAANQSPWEPASWD